MTSLPNPFSHSGAPIACTPDDAAAPSSQAYGAAADICEPTSSTGGCQEASTPTTTVTVAAGGVDATDCIGEIFAGALKLFDPDPAGYTNADHVYYDLLKATDDPHAPDLIEMPYGMEGLFDEPPLFLRQAG